MKYKVLPKIFDHKKFQAGITTTLVLLFTQLGPAIVESPTFWIALGSITAGEWLLIIGPILTAIGAQGFADSGKEAAKINTGQINGLAQIGKELAESKEEIE